MSRVRLELGVVEVEGPEQTDELADTARLLWWETQAPAGGPHPVGFTQPPRITRMGPPTGRIIYADEETPDA